jgi:hypothetical protein
MAATPYTPFCHQCYDLVKRLNEYSTVEIFPKMRGLREQGARPDRNRDAIIFGVYATVHAWLNTFENLNHSYDFQAVGTGARAIFERYLDLKWFEKFTGPEWLARYANFANVDRYLSAEKVVEHVKKNPSSKIETKVYVDFMAKVDAIEPLEVLVTRVWGKKPDETPCWPNFHWTGIKDLSQRAERIGPEAIDAYREIYPPMSWLVHAGPTAFLGRDFSEIETQIGWCYLFAFQLGRASAITAVKILGIRKIVADFDKAMNQLWQWRSDALATLPVG